VRDRLIAIVEERARVKLAAQGPLLEAGAAVTEAALVCSTTRKSYTGRDPQTQCGGSSTKWSLGCPVS
jgi:hypothetical protein